MSGAASAENNVLVRRNWEGLVGTGDPALADALLAPGYVVRFAGNPSLDRAGSRQVLGAQRAAFPDLRVTVEGLLAEGDRVAVRWTWRGNQRGAYLGLAPTGRAVTGSGIGLFRVAHGQIAEDFVQEDTFGLLQQFGAVPAPGAGGGGVGHGNGGDGEARSRRDRVLPGET